MNEGKLRARDEAPIMANMPTFENACELARERGLFDRIGVHLVFHAMLNARAERPLEQLVEPVRALR